MRIFISGAITGRKEAKSDFDAAARVIMKKGHTPVNPYYNGWLLPDGSHTEYMILAFTVMEMCEAVYMIPGWENSEGARMEERKARHSRMTIFYDAEGIPNDRNQQ